MRLLVSVRNAPEARAALAGGADIIDAKEPINGPLGAVSSDVLREIAATVGNAAPVSAALGEVHEDGVMRRAVAARQAGVAFVKVGFAGMGRRPRLTEDVLTLARAAQPPALVLVAYADFDLADAPPPAEILTLAAHIKPAGILLDTYDKGGASLTSLMHACTLATFVSRAKAPGCFVALAGRLTLEDIETVQDTGADVIGLRGAACDGGRGGVVTSVRVRALCEHMKGTRHVY
jgi:(5-formylfuran-3-yl)methyl phosphate synthase